MRRTITHEMAIARGRSLTGFWERVLCENSFFSHLHLLNDEVEVVPPCVREETGVEGQGDARGVGDGVLPCEVLCPTVAKLDKPGHKQQWSISRKERATLTL